MPTRLLMLCLLAGCVEDSLRRAPEDTSDDGGVDTDDTDGPAAALEVDLLDIDAGTWIEGCTSLPQTRRLLNVGDIDAVFAPAEVTGPQAERFEVTAPDELAVGASGEVTVRFTPSGEGPASAEIALPYNGGTLSWTVSGRGGDEVVWTETRWQPQVDALDMLLLVDRSGSSQDEQDTNYGSIASELGAGLGLAEVDWQLGVTGLQATDEGPGTAGKLAGSGVLTVATGDPGVTMIAAGLAVPEGNETRPFDALVAAVTSANGDFPRDGVPLGVFILSDADDDSMRSADATRAAIGDQGEGDLVMVSGIVGDPVLSCAPLPDPFGDAADRAPRLRDLIADSGGRRADWCGPMDDAQKLAQEFAVRATGVPQSFEPVQTPKNLIVGKDIRDVTVDGISVPEGSEEGWTWSATRQAIELHGSWLAPPGVRVDLTYALPLDAVCGP